MKKPVRAPSAAEAKGELPVTTILTGAAAERQTQREIAAANAAIENLRSTINRGWRMIFPHRFKRMEEQAAAAAAERARAQGPPSSA